MRPPARPSLVLALGLLEMALGNGGLFLPHPLREVWSGVGQYHVQHMDHGGETVTGALWEPNRDCTGLCRESGKRRTKETLQNTRNCHGRV